MRIEAEAQEKQTLANAKLEIAKAETIKASGEANARAIEENGKIEIKKIELKNMEQI